MCLLLARLSNGPGLKKLACSSNSSSPGLVAWVQPCCRLPTLYIGWLDHDELHCYQIARLGPISSGVHPYRQYRKWLHRSICFRSMVWWHIAPWLWLPSHVLSNWSGTIFVRLSLELQSYHCFPNGLSYRNCCHCFPTDSSLRPE